MNKLSILQINTFDIAGGAEKVAWDLFQAYKDLEYQSTLVVGTKRSNDPSVFCIPNDEYRSLTAKIFISIGNCLDPFVKKIPLGKKFNKNLKTIGETKRIINKINGIEDFNYPGTSHVLEITTRKPNIVHCHNLHGGYFDLRMLPSLSHHVPVVMTLHDAWLLSGNCAHSFNCDRWKIGCGNCPDITIYPGIRKDATAYNWIRKKEIFERSRLYITTPSQWLMEKVNKSILKSAIIKSKVINNGVDLWIFHPYNQSKARQELGLPKEDKILLFAANGIRKNPWKDYNTLKRAISEVSKIYTHKKILFLALGETAPPEKIGHTKVQFIPYQKDPVKIARYYQAADMYIHASLADTFPNTILESLACGTPVIATKVGGIPEQIEDGITGFLVPAGDGDLMAARINDLLQNDYLRKKFGQKASEVAYNKFNLGIQVEKYLDWYKYVIEINKR
ncbi:glycosyltransferase [Methanosarcina vacuolata]|uniref:Glycosyltransferase n=1 Tax=Methanosarcina vacuolata Z-761 TaxID=1434123 RepID=A0A0E3LHY9_9EURY|nr:glycosyltransferase [Methanosarcina vacuolata]AKB45101.1 hypothetical protein MSVAZ_2832 [Methanosarcina vacuolata Z-761]